MVERMRARHLAVVSCLVGLLTAPRICTAADGFQAAKWGMSLTGAATALGCTPQDARAGERFQRGAEHLSCRREVLGYPVVVVLAGSPRLSAVRVLFLREGDYLPGPNRAGPVASFANHYRKALGVLRTKYGRDVESKDGPTEWFGYPVAPKVKFLTETGLCDLSPV